MKDMRKTNFTSFLLYVFFIFSFYPLFHFVDSKDLFGARPEQEIALFLSFLVTEKQKRILCPFR